MKAYLNRVDGLDDAVLSMYYSKRSIGRKEELEIRRQIHACQDMLGEHGPIGSLVPDQITPETADILDKLFKWGRKHITMLRFIDLSFTVYGLHRGGQDDWDAHAYRFNNRIIRQSTRLGDFAQNEMSDWYKGKIIPTDMALAILGIATPPEITGPDGQVYVKGVNGYILKGHENEKDYKRGLYMLSIPSSFIFRIQLLEFCHVYKERNNLGTANPEVKIACEDMADQTAEALPGYVTRDLLEEVKQ